MDHTGADFFHRDALQLVMPVRYGPPLETRQSAAPELLGALRGDVDEQEPARDGGGAFSLGRVAGPFVRIALNHDLSDYLKRLENAMYIVFWPAGLRETSKGPARAGPMLFAFLRCAADYSPTTICLALASSRCGNRIVKTPSR